MLSLYTTINKYHNFVQKYTKIVKKALWKKKTYDFFFSYE